MLDVCNVGMKGVPIDLFCFILLCIVGMNITPFSHFA